MKTVDNFLKTFIKEKIVKLNKMPDLYFFLKYYLIFLIFFLVIASVSLLRILSVESNPFFYETF